MQFQSNIGYANSKKWDGVWFKEKKPREIIVLCRINWWWLCRKWGGEVAFLLKMGSRG